MINRHVENFVSSSDALDDEFQLIASNDNLINKLNW